VAGGPVVNPFLAPLFIAFVDMLLCLLIHVLLLVNPAQTHNVDMHVVALASIDWDVEHYDADVDIWLVTPSGVPVFYAAGNRQVGCATLDMDNKGWVDSNLPPGQSQTAILRAKEVVAMRCIEPGHYVLGVNLFTYHDHYEGRPEKKLGVKVHVEVEHMDPVTTTVLARDVTLDRVSDTINVVAFDVDREGNITLSPDVPLKLVTEYRPPPK
jgi:hypothetical protein